MPPKIFFYIALLFPIAGAGLAFISDVFALLRMALEFSRIAYPIAAIIGAMAIALAKSERDLKKIALISPIIFTPISILCFYIEIISDNSFIYPNMNDISFMVPIGLYSLLIGYAYVAITLGFYEFIKNVGLIRRE